MSALGRPGVLLLPGLLLACPGKPSSGTGEHPSDTLDSSAGHSGETSSDSEEDSDVHVDTEGIYGFLGPENADAIFYDSDSDTRAGRAAVGLGDMDGDGLDDIALSSSNASTKEREEVGAVLLLYAPFMGEVLLSSITDQVVGEFGEDHAGFLLAGPGDVTGDGIPDLLVGTYTYGERQDRDYLVPGPITGSVELASAAGTYSGRLMESADVNALTGPGDLNADGLAEIAIGSPLDDDVAVFLGPALGDHSLEDAEIYLQGPQDERAGGAVAGAGDINGDGWPDLLIGETGNPEGEEAGRVYLVLGPMSGTFLLTGADAILTGVHPGDLAGAAVAGDDTNADGYSDLLVGAPGARYRDDPVADGGGLNYLFQGPVTGIMSLDDAHASILGSTGWEQTGRASKIVQDLDGDSRADILLGGPQSWTGEEYGGAAFVFYGPITGALETDEADASFAGVQAGDRVGMGVAGAGDTNGDGFGDILICSFWNEIYLLLGGEPPG